MTGSPLKIGFLLNPIAGIGGPVALKGSDGVVAEAISRGGERRSAERAAACIAALGAVGREIEWLTMPQEMGESLLVAQGIPCTVLGEIVSGETTADDTKRGVALFEQAGVDLLLFGGGDGTARDVFDASTSSKAILGIPCGVKMHSGVFATSPGAAAELISKMARGDLLSVVSGEVRDIDEHELRDGRLNTRFYGELPVPDDIRYVQHTKSGGREAESLVLTDIAAEIGENLEADTFYLMGLGSTVAGLMEAMKLEATLLGVDVLFNGELVAQDATEEELWAVVSGDHPSRIVVTVIGGQGYVFGRGNQQLSPRIIRRVGKNNIYIVATKTKLKELEGRPLLVDTGDAGLDDELSGTTEVITGYEDRVLYRVGS